MRMGLLGGGSRGLCNPEAGFLSEGTYQVPEAGWAVVGEMGPWGMERVAFCGVERRCSG